MCNVGQAWLFPGNCCTHVTVFCRFYYGVAVMNTEPQRLPTDKTTEAVKVNVLTIRYDIIAGVSDGANLGLALVKKWAVGGHSMGAFRKYMSCEMSGFFDALFYLVYSPPLF